MTGEQYRLLSGIIFYFLLQDFDDDEEPLEELLLEDEELLPELLRPEFDLDERRYDVDLPELYDLLLFLLEQLPENEDFFDPVEFL